MPRLDHDPVEGKVQLPRQRRQVGDAGVGQGEKHCGLIRDQAGEARPEEIIIIISIVIIIIITIIVIISIVIIMNESA